MRILVDASRLGVAGPEEQDFFRDVVRQLLCAGREHSFGIVGWPRELGTGPAEFLSPLPRDAASWHVARTPSEAAASRPTVWYSPLGWLSQRARLAVGTSAPRIESCFCPGEERAPQAITPPDDRLWTVTVSRSTFTVLVEHEGHSVRRVRQLGLPALPHSFGSDESGRLDESTRQLRPGSPYVLATLTGSTPSRFAAMVQGVLQHRARGGADLRLLVMGRPTAAMRRVAWWPRLRGRVRFVGPLPRRVRGALLAGAEAFVLTGGGDGSWIASREALAVGTPVLAPLESPVTEILGDAALYYAPSDPRDLAEALGRCRRCEALRRLLAQRGIHRADVGSLDRFVQGLLEVISEAEAATVASERPRKVLA